MESFVANCYPQFYAELHSSLRSEQIDYYPLYFQTEKDDKGREVIFKDAIEYRNPETGNEEFKEVERPHIMVKDIRDPGARDIWTNVRKIQYSIVGYDRLLNDVMQMAEVSKGGF